MGSENQPRVPAGSPDGGEWTDGGGGGEYHRYSKSDTGSQDVPWQMLSRSEEDVKHGYGDKHFVADSKGAVPAETLKPEIAAALDRHPEITDDLQSTGSQLAREATPSRIVDSAGLWDNPAVVQVVYDEVLAPKGITKVETPDGLIVFDPAEVRRKE